MVGLERWEDIDRPIWVVDEEACADDPTDRVGGVERFFDYLSYQFESPGRRHVLISCK